MDNKFSSKKQLFITFLLSLGTCFEFFDFMLFLHLGFILNSLFFPEIIKNIISFDINAFSFCLTYLFTPIGALLMGIIGDKYGRKTSIILSTLAMFVSCIIIAFLPTYASIGILSTIIYMLCRILQSMTSTGELVAVWVYLSETINIPFAYVCVSFANSLGIAGHGLAVAVAILAKNLEKLNYRYLFLFGSLIVAIPLISRIFLQETQEFLDFKKRTKDAAKLQGGSSRPDQALSSYINKYQRLSPNKKLLVSTFFLHCASPIRFCFIYFYVAKILVDRFLYTTSDVMIHNVKIVFIHAIGSLLSALLAYKICPLKLIKIKAFGFLGLVLSIFYILQGNCSAQNIFVLQALIMLFPFDAGPSEPILLKYFPTHIRLKYFTCLFSFSRMSMYFLSTIFVPYAYKFFGHYILLIFLPIIIGFIISADYFQKLHKINN